MPDSESSSRRRREPADREFVPPEALDAYFASKPLQALTRRTVVREQTLRAVLKEVRQQGWAFSDEESEIGVRTVAAPIVEHTHQVQAAINVSGHAARVSMRELKKTYLPRLLESARQISTALGARPGPMAPAARTGPRHSRTRR